MSLQPHYRCYSTHAEDGSKGAEACANNMTENTEYELEDIQIFTHTVIQEWPESQCQMKVQTNFKMCMYLLELESV